jgi:hypothetical protein
MIEEKKLYPITYLKNLDSANMRRLTSGGVLLLKQLVESSPESLAQKARIPRKILQAIQQQARIILSDKN